jgi:hypothetical protein
LQTVPTSTSPDDEKTKDCTRRWWRHLLSGLVTLFVLGSLFIYSARLYFDDLRLQSYLLNQIQSSLRAPVSLGKLELNFFKGLTLTNLEIGAPADFKCPLLSIEKISLSWELAALLRRELVISSLDVQKPTLCIEQIETQGLNIFNMQPSAGVTDTLSVSNTKNTTKAPSTSQNIEFVPPALAPLPFVIDIQNVSIRKAAVRGKSPDKSFDMNGLYFQSSMRLENATLSAQLKTGIGVQKPGLIRLAQRGAEKQEARHVLIKAVAELSVLFQGFDNIRVTLNVDAPTQAWVPQALPPVTLLLNLDSLINLSEQNLSLLTFEAAAGDMANLDLALNLSSFLSSGQKMAVELKRLDSRFNLSEINPWLALWQKDAKSEGSIGLKLKAPKSTVGTFSQVQQIAGELGIKFQEVHFESNLHKIEALNARIKMNLQDGHLRSDIEAQWQAFKAKDLSFGSMRLTQFWTGPVDAWLNAPGNIEEACAQSQLISDLELENVRSDKTFIESIKLGLILNSGVHEQSKKPGHSHLNTQLKVNHIFLPDLRLASLNLQSDTELLAILDFNVGVKLKVQAGPLVIGRGENRVALPASHASTEAVLTKLYQDISSIHFTLGDIFSMNMMFKGSLMDETAPFIDSMKLHVPDFRLASVIGLLPPHKRPKGTIEGGLGASIHSVGKIKLKTLAQWFKTESLEENAAWQQKVHRSKIYVEGWLERLNKGIGFTLTSRLHLNDFHYRDPSLNVEKSTLKWLGAIGPKGVMIESSFQGARLGVGTKLIRDPSFSSLLRLDGFKLSASSNMGASAYQAFPGSSTVLNASAKAGMGYEWEGDLVLEEISINTSTPATDVTIKGAVLKPLRLIGKRGWQKPGVPGLEAWLDLQSRIETAQPFALGDSGKIVQGELGFLSQLVFKKGRLKLSGLMDFVDFSLFRTSMPLAGKEDKRAPWVGGVVGQLPYQMQFVFQPTPGTVFLAVNSGIGTGHLALVTEKKHDDRRANRAAEYERLMPYRKNRGLQINHMIVGQERLENIHFDAFIREGKLSIEQMAFQMLGADMDGHAAMQLSFGGKLLTQASLRVSNFDASHIQRLGLQPGSDSELCSDFNFRGSFARGQRDIAMDINFTKLGRTSFDRLLQALTHENNRDKMEAYRKQLQWISIDSVSLWARHELMNMNLTYTTDIPWYRPLPTDLLRRYSLSESLDVYLQPTLDHQVGPLLGW